MATAHDEPDPIKSNPTSHKAIGVVGMLVLLVGLAWCLKGDRRTKPVAPAADTAVAASAADTGLTK